MSSVVNKLTNAAERESSESEALIAEIRKAIGEMKSIAVDYEKENKSDKVKQLEAAALELVASCVDCTCYADAIRKVPGAYQPSNQMTDFEKLIEAEVNKVKGNSSTSVENHLLIRQFREAVWNVHHAGEPMPGDEQEDVLMTSTQTSILNVTCPLTGKPVIQLTEPVRWFPSHALGATGVQPRTQRPVRSPRGLVDGCWATPVCSHESSARSAVSMAAWPH